MAFRTAASALFLLVALLAMTPGRAEDPAPPPEPAPAPTEKPKPPAQTPPPAPAPTSTSKPPAQAPPPAPAPTSTAKPAAQAAAPAPAPAPAPEKKEGFFRRLWPREDDVAQASAAPGTTAPGVPRRLVVVQQRLRASRVGTDLTGIQYLDIVDSGSATAAQLNAFGVWLAGQGILEPAEQYFRAASELDHADPEVWNNLGMVQLRLDDAGAKSSFEKAIALDATHARAHYNLGIFHDDQGDYDTAIQEYTRALLLDPRLGDPAYNPQVVNNPRLLVVRMGLYERKAKTVGLSMGQTAPKK